MNTTIRSVRNLLNDNLDFGDIRLRGTHFYITTYPDELDHNLDIFLAKFEPAGALLWAGILAAAGLLALEDGLARLHEDHALARSLAGEIQKTLEALQEAKDKEEAAGGDVGSGGAGESGTGGAEADGDAGERTEADGEGRSRSNREKCTFRILFRSESA